MKISELIRLDERAPLLNKLTNAAKIHYNTNDDQEALLLYLARGMMHSEEDDKELKKEVSQLSQKVNNLSNKINSQKSSVPNELVKLPTPKQGIIK